MPQRRFIPPGTGIGQAVQHDSSRIFGIRHNPSPSVSLSAFIHVEYAIATCRNTCEVPSLHLRCPAIAGILENFAVGFGVAAHPNPQTTNLDLDAFERDDSLYG